LSFSLNIFFFLSSQNATNSTDTSGGVGGVDDATTDKQLGDSIVLLHLVLLEQQRPFLQILQQTRPTDHQRLTQLLEDKA
jgi:hypothetical protein